MTGDGHDRAVESIDERTDLVAVEPGLVDPSELAAALPQFAVRERGGADGDGQNEREESTDPDRTYEVISADEASGDGARTLRVRGRSEDINDGADGPVSLERLPAVNGHDGLATALSFHRRLLIKTEIEAAEDIRLPGDTAFDDVTDIVVGSDDIDSDAFDEGVAVAAELPDETIQRRFSNLERHHRVVGGPTERDAEAGLPDESSFTTVETVDIGSEDPPVEHRLVADSSARALRRAVDWSQDRDPNEQTTQDRDLNEQTI